MPTTHIQPVRSLKTRLEYVTYGSGPEGTARRNAHDAARPIGFVCDFSSREEMATFARRLIETNVWRMYEGYEVRVSWSREELVPENPEHVALALDYGIALARELFPNTPVAITAHGDGQGRCLHLHMDFINVDLGTGLALAGNGRNHATIAAVADTLAYEHGMNVVRHAVHGGAWAERREELVSSIDGAKEKVAAGGKWTRSLRDNAVALAIGDAIDETIRAHAREIRDEHDLERYLGEAGVYVIRKETKDGVGFTYKMAVELEGKTRDRRCKASKISREYSADRVMETVRAEAESQRLAEEAEAEARRVEGQARIAAEEAERLAREEEAARIAEERAKAEAEAAAAEAARLERERADEAARREGERRAAAARKASEEASQRTLRSKLAASRAWSRRREEAVKVTRTVGDERSWTVTVDMMMFGSLDGVRHVDVRESALVACAHAASLVLDEERPGSRLADDLHDFCRDDVRAKRFPTMAKDIAEDCAQACRAQVHDGGTEPRGFVQFFADGFRTAMRASMAKERGEGRALPSVKTVLLGMFGRIAAEFGVAQSSMRDRARSVLVELGVIRADRREYGNQRTQIRTAEVEPTAQESVAPKPKATVGGFDPAHGAGVPVRRSVPAIDLSRLTNLGDEEAQR